MEKIYDYWLCCVEGVGNITWSHLLEQFGSAKAIYLAEKEELQTVLREKQLIALLQSKQQWDLDKEYEKLHKAGISFLRKNEKDYPKRLCNIPDAPNGIFYKGKLPPESMVSVAIIGARECSEYGSYVARELGKLLGECGIPVISGMARGIDGISQGAVLAAGGTTTAVLGCGVDICYPKQNRRLYDRILEQGGIVSTYPPGTLPKAGNFPPRNRIVSGLSDVVVVIEARRKSGTLITVDMALEQGKEVYVVPGRITDRLSDGCNRLLKQGAEVLLSPREFVKELEELWQFCLSAVTCGEEERKETIKTKLPEELELVYRVLDFTPKSTEQILGELKENASVNELNVRLMKLCIQGMAIQQYPGYFSVSG